MIRILIVDDHAVLRGGLKQILAEEFPEVEFGEAGTAQEALDCLQKQRWDVLLLDVFLPGRSGLEVLQESRKEFPRLPVLVVSSAPEEQMALRVLKAGAGGYINKQAAPEYLVQAVRKVLGGGRYVSPTLAEKLAGEIGAGGQAAHETLSNREYETMLLLVAGRTLKEIATRLSLSVKTISTFHTRILHKLRLQNDVELVHYALEHGLLERRDK